jgi:putative redox protein
MRAVGHPVTGYPACGSVGRMTTDSAHRGIRIERTGPTTYVAINDRGGRMTISQGQGTDFTPVDLLLAAIGGCTAIDVDLVTSRRAEPERFEVLVDAEKVRGGAGNHGAGNHLTDLQVTFRVSFPEGEAGDKARAILPDIVKKSHDRLCTVSRTVEIGTPIATRIE